MATCGNGHCDATLKGENCVNCPQDCGTPCGNLNSDLFLLMLLKACVEMEVAILPRIALHAATIALVVSNQTLNYAFRS